MKIKGVSVDFIDGLNEAAKSTYPDEFICLHRAHDGIIDEIVVSRRAAEEAAKAKEK